MPLSQWPEELRRAPREMVDCQALVWGATQPPVPALIVNVSPHGCMIRCETPMPMGEGVTIDSTHIGLLRGVVIWSLGARIGIEFHNALPLPAYLDLLDRIREATEVQPLDSSAIAASRSNR